MDHLLTLLKQPQKPRKLGALSVSENELFKEPPPKEDCPICLLPMPFSHIEHEPLSVQRIYQACCGRSLCSACMTASQLELGEGDLESFKAACEQVGTENVKDSCPFCKVKGPSSNEESIMRCKMRMELNDAEAFYELGHAYYNGKQGLPQDTKKACELWNQAVEFGSMRAHSSLAAACIGVDKNKAIRHFKHAAIGGDGAARTILGAMEADSGKVDRATKHFMIAARNGNDESLKRIGEGYKAGLVTKDEYASTLRAYKNTQDAMKSVQRFNISFVAVSHGLDRVSRPPLLGDEAFKDPPPKEECPICMLPMPYADKICGTGAMFYPCCGKRICHGCALASKDEIEKGNLKAWCLCCRVSMHSSMEEFVERCNKRIMLGDAEACYFLGRDYCDRDVAGSQRDLNKALQLWEQGSKLGSVRASFELALAYHNGKGGVKKDEKKAIQLWKLAAIGGHERARHCLGLLEDDSNKDMAVKHWMIAARAGLDVSLKVVGEGYKAGYVTKDEYASTLRAYQSCRNEMKSKQRAEAAVLMGLMD